MRRLTLVALTLAAAVPAPLAQTPTGPRAVEPPFAFVESSIREARSGSREPSKSSI